MQAAAQSGLVVQWRLTGGYGYASPGAELIVPPGLVVYADGRAVADATTELMLTPDEVTALSTAVAGDLAGLPAVVTPAPVTSGTVEMVADAGSTEITVRTADGRLQVVAGALNLLPGYPDRLHAAAQRLWDLAARVSRDGRPYIAERVRLVAENRESGDARPWPADIPVPDVSRHPAGAGTADLSGAPAEAVRFQLVGARYGANAWPLLRADDGRVYAVSWRYLLPHE